MLILRLENWPDGDQSRSEDLGQATLTLIGGDADGDVGNYELTITDHGTQIYKGWADGHRKKNGPWELVRLAFSSISSRIRRAEEIDRIDELKEAVP